MVDNNNNNNGSSTNSSQQIQIFQIESSRDPEQGKILRNEIESLAVKFIELDDTETKILREKKMIILEMADKFEQLKELGEYIFPITYIASDIYRYLNRKGYDVTKQYVYEVIREFAPQYSNNINNPNSNLYQNGNSLPNDIKIEQVQTDNEVNHLYKINPQLLTRHQISEHISKLDNIIQKYVDYAKQQNILILSEQETDSTPHYDSEEADPFKDSVITDQPEARPSNISGASFRLENAFYLLSKTIGANARMMVDYPPEIDDPELEVKGANEINEMADFILELDRSIKGGTDRKYRRSILQWAAITDDEEMWGKHAASSKNPYIARFRDPKTGEWKTEIRKLTREQIGDKAPKVREFTLTFKRYLPAFYRFMKWSELCLHQYTNGESVKLGPKLSDRSLR